eukprot:TRINITY_DN3231_c0_g1_i1.p1 TRINITY_DN3231_c0_g1~~TRINITY_DN3231_c0_g1_i1.p1  ORF type:complete len:126 (-),score=27.04 TRINITY_DN3231_c0_g1_i1:339-716(-)
MRKEHIMSGRTITTHSSGAMKQWYQRRVREEMLTRALRTSSMAGRQEILLTRAKKKTGGKKKAKAKIEPPEGFCVDMLAKDWANWPNGEAIDVSIPWTEDNEPEWVNRLYESQAYFFFLSCTLMW